MKITAIAVAWGPATPGHGAHAVLHQEDASRYQPPCERSGADAATGGRLGLQPRVLEGLAGGGPLAIVHHHEVLDCAPALLRDSLPALVEHDLALASHLHEEVVVGCVHGQRSTQRGEEHCAGGPNVHFEAVAAAEAEHLWCHVAERAAPLREDVLLGLAAGREAEVAQLDAVALREGCLAQRPCKENVLGLYVSVNDTLPMQEVERREELPCNHGRAGLLQSDKRALPALARRPLPLVRRADDLVEEVAPPADVHDEADDLRLLEETVQGHDVPVSSQGLLDADFACQATVGIAEEHDHVPLAEAGLVDDLAGKISTAVALHALVDGTKGTFAQLALHLVGLSEDLRVLLIGLELLLVVVLLLLLLLLQRL
mmetsp:Transcript_49358/g.118745  ORF Transcript_49358/g.118745 Transcript_49358/m.118745 type:complete len:372 (-) Transcript_49358:119-1234(-)